MKILFFILLSIPVFSACSNNDSTKGSSMPNGIYEEQGRKNMKSGDKWRMDTCGCLGYRSIEIARALIDEFDLLDKSTDEFERVFGISNEKECNGEEIVLSYYLQSVCDNNNKLLEDADKCWVDFVFIDNRLTEKPNFYKIE